MCPISRHVTTLAQKTHLCFCAATVAETKNPFGLFDRAALEITASKPRKKKPQQCISCISIYFMFHRSQPQSAAVFVFVELISNLLAASQRLMDFYDGN